MRSLARLAFVLFVLVPAALPAQPGPAAGRDPRCSPDNGGITLPAGFCATVFADSLPGPRHLVVAPNGDVFVALMGGRSGGRGVVALRDADRDGVADAQRRFGDFSAAGMAVRGRYLYTDDGSNVLRYTLAPGALEPSGGPDTVVTGLPSGGHRTKTLALDSAGTLFVNVGSRTNACQERDRTAGSRGVDPCVELETRAGIWAFRADRLGQTQRDGRRYATGIRNGVALAYNPADRTLWVAQHGRDQLSGNWPALFTDEKNAETPSEELFRVRRGDDFGWPYCYHDTELGAKVLAPEYGGNGRTAGRCSAKQGNVAAFPGHWAPMALLFYTGRALPARYRDGVFVAFHGSWNRAPLPQAGFNVVFQPLRGGRAAGAYETFADGFMGADALRAPRPGRVEATAGQRRHRPAGLAQGPDGALYISDDTMGRIWKVVYVGRE